MKWYKILSSREKAFKVVISKTVNSASKLCTATRYMYMYTTARVFVLRIRVLCAFPTRCTCVEFKLRMKRESTYFETREYSLAALQRVSTIKYAFLPLANQIVLLQRSDA